MRPEEHRLLVEIVKQSGVVFPTRTSTNNPLENSYWSNLIDGALKALEIVAIQSLDWKLVGIVKLLKSWLTDKRREKEELRTKTEYGYNDSRGFLPNDSNDSWSNTYY